MEEQENRRESEQMEVERSSDSEAAFESLGLNPRLFLNDVLNAVDDLTDSALDHFLQSVPPPPPLCLYLSFHLDLSRKSPPGLRFQPRMEEK